MLSLKLHNLGGNADYMHLPSSLRPATAAPICIVSGGDFNADPYIFTANGQFVNGGCSATSDAFMVTFPAAVGYPGGLPVALSNVYYVNRLGGLNTRITTSNGRVQLYAPNASQVAQSGVISSATVSTITFNTPQPAMTPVPTLPVQMDPTQRLFSVRYIQINAAVGRCL